MRLNAKAVVALFALLLGPASAVAQESPAPAAPSPSAVNPRGPIPYTQLRQRTAPRPAPRPTVRSAAPMTASAGPATPLEPVPVLPRTPSGARLAQGEALPPAELESFLDGVIRDAMAREHIAGVTVSVVQNGQILLKKGYGFSDLSPQRRVDPDRTLFRIGSISKTFTWIALMKEIEAGRIRANSPVNLYLPEKLQAPDDGYSNPVRVAQLMDHSAGFEDRALGQLFERKYSRVRPLSLYLRQERPRRVREPGAVSSYSNYGVALAGQAVSYVADKPFERLIEDEIIVPLRLTQTTFREPHPVKEGLPAPMPARLADDVSDGFRWTGVDFRAQPYEYIGQIAPAGSASSTAGDMARYMLMLLNGGTLDGVAIYGPRTAQAFRTPLRRTPPGVNGWAHGFIVYDLPGGRRGYGHDGATMSFMSSLVVAPDLNLGVFVSTNTATGAELTHRLPVQLIEQFYQPPRVAPPPPSPALREAADLYTGRYVSTRRAYGGLEGFVGLLIGGASVEVTPEGRLTVAGPDRVTSWTPEGAPSSGRFISLNGNDRLVFDVSDGQARSFQDGLGAAQLERVGFLHKPTTLATLAALAALAAAATLVGVVLRNRREFRESGVQTRMSLIQNIQAALWLTAMILFAMWAARATEDQAAVMYGWPGPFLVIASACALVATLMTIITIVFLPAILRGGRRVDSWTDLRKAFFTMTVVIYTLFAVALFFWGALNPVAG